MKNKPNLEGDFFNIINIVRQYSGVNDQEEW